MPRIRVAHVITRLIKGGAQENTFHTVRLHDAARFEADLIAGPPLGAEGSIEDVVRAAGVDIQREPWLLRNPAPLRDLMTLRRLEQRFRRGRYDIVHTHTSKAGWLGRIAAERAGVPIIVHTPHGNVFHGYFSPAVARAFVWMERYAARRTDAIIELTPGGIEEHLAEGIGQRSQYRVIFSGIDTAPYDDAIAMREATRAALGCPPGALLIGGVGRLEPIKGFTYFVEAALRLADALPEARFVLAGQGSETEAIRRRAAPLGDRFQMLGLRADVPALMAAFDVCVVPSVNEGMGRVLLEAGAAGTPVAASRVGGIPDIVDDGETGLLVAPRDADALAAALRELAASPERRALMGAAARAKVVPRFSLEAMVRDIESLYEELLHEKAPDRRG
ncbi:MAG: glycosyltransferase [Candidatus Hydrogenedens sp.]|nr:glycosyltransferase [Candidatus Hydrogenedens sp.]